MIEWADNVLDKPVFPEWSMNNKKSKAKSYIIQAYNIRGQGKRADISNLSIYVICCEIFIQVTGEALSLSDPGFN